MVKIVLGISREDLVLQPDVDRTVTQVGLIFFCLFEFTLLYLVLLDWRINLVCVHDQPFVRTLQVLGLKLFLFVILVVSAERKRDG